MKILKLTENNKSNIIQEAIQILRNGGIVIYPTETTYGIGVDPTNQNAVDKLLSYKAKRHRKPLSIAVCCREMAQKYVEINNIADNYYNNYLPGPITVVSRSKGKVAKFVESQDKTIGVRIPDYQFILDLISKFQKPITATSANASYKKRPYKIEDILSNISDKQKNLIDLIIDAGELPKNDPSTVIDTVLNAGLVLRQGNIKLSEKEKFISQSPENTRKIGFNLMKKYYQYVGYKSIIFAMKGELGAGKTEMTKGIAEALEIQEQIKSPTYIIEDEYNIQAPEGSFVHDRQVKLFHLDVWRLYEAKELEDLNFYRQVEECNVFVIEWADKVIPVLKNVVSDAIVIWVEISYGEEEEERKVVVSDFK